MINIKYDRTGQPLPFEQQDFEEQIRKQKLEEFTPEYIAPSPEYKLVYGVRWLDRDEDLINGVNPAYRWFIASNWQGKWNSDAGDEIIDVTRVIDLESL